MPYFPALTPHFSSVQTLNPLAGKGIYAFFDIISPLGSADSLFNLETVQSEYGYFSSSFAGQS
jgi:hypothetical protein